MKDWDVYFLVIEKLESKKKRRTITTSWGHGTEPFLEAISLPSSERHKKVSMECWKRGLMEDK